MSKFKIKRYRWPMLHLVLCSGVIGFLFVFLLNLPFLLISPYSHTTWRVSAKLTLLGLTILRWTQPWWRGEIDVKLPTSVAIGDEGCLLVSNHRSHLDVFLFLQQVACVRILTKHLIFLVPGLGAAAILFRMIMVRRGNEASFWKSMEKLEVALKEKDTVLVFPEMSRSAFGKVELGRFTLAPFQKAMITGVPVVPVVLWGTDYIWPKEEFKMALKGPLIVRSFEPVMPHEFETAADLSAHVKAVIQNEVNRLNQSHSYESFSQ